MQDVLAQLFSYLSGVWRYRWMGLLAAWVVAIAGWGLVYQMPQQYEATARIHVDTNSVLRPLLRGLAIQPDIDQRVQLMSRTLLSRPNLEKLTRMTDLDLQVKTEKEKEQLFAGLKNAISLSGDRRNFSLYSVSYYHPDRDVAKKVVQALITVFVESAMGEKRGDSSDAQSFLDQQIEEYENRLVEAETKLANFKQKHAGVLPGEAGGYYQRLLTAKEEHSQARLRLNEMINRRNELKRQLSGEQPVFLSSGSGESASSSLDGRIHNLNAKLDDLLSRYTEKHPEVVQIRSLIKALEEERSAELEKVMAGGASDLSGLNQSPVYQQMRGMLAEAEASVAELSVRVNEYRRREKELTDMVDKIPAIEAELTQLNRDYEVVSQQHTELMERREAARISEDVELQAGDVVFKVIDPPFVPLRPNKPNKLLLNSGVLVVALGVGVGLALLLSLLKPVIADRRTLARVTGLPVLGCVTNLATPEQKRRSFIRRLQFSVLALLLVVVFAGINLGQQWALA
jgi:polysaccharide chain length determinant protein (PEP-CTERM system associated)